MLAHGMLTDDEPDMRIFDDQEKVTEEFRQPHFWKTVRLDCAVSHEAANFRIDDDHIFAEDGTELPRGTRKLAALINQQIQVVIWHSWIVPRQRRSLKRKKRAGGKHESKKKPTGSKRR